MSDRSKSPMWILLHAALVIAVICSLFSGLRIATLTKPAIASIEELLPQGEVHSVHFFSALLLSLVALSYLYSNAIRLYRIEQSCAHKQWNYHRVVTWGGISLIGISLASGWLLFAGIGQLSLVRILHFFAALGLSVYIFLHAGVYLLQFGQSALLYILKPATNKRIQLALLCSLLPIFLLGGWLLLTKFSYYQLPVTSIPIHTIIDIDGHADEPQWAKARPLKISTDGGANFYQGRTDVHLKALQNGEEIYFHISWQDPTESLTHLPLIKTDQGWKIQQQGFENFDEKNFYEDKFALLLSSNCNFGGAGTAHLGRSPLANKPSNWHGKGYHYSQSGQLHDLWHWKAVRTNKMYLADDNFIGAPDKVRAGKRRYTAGYQQDAKESGAYLLNWKWYSPTGITPKRLPSDANVLAPFQNVKEGQELDWTISWFDYQPYSAESDRIAPGTLMPSVLYTSNRFEGDRADVRAKGIWRDGYWSLELVRKLNTASPLDIPIEDGTCLWVSAFDRAQVAHTRHTRAIQLNLSKAQ
ncbi:ethylbenzene dehydrogenase-related protein [Microbulbifer sp. DLAB2-AA]|uniref:ethylbenzene dehydrogenase-related protein n=1 Tax=Microbulbifer sp. DLAB2-AA TaxID=3243394 RepID=UPI00403A627F